MYVRLTQKYMICYAIEIELTDANQPKKLRAKLSDLETVTFTYNWCASKIHFRANVIAYLFTLARKWTFHGHQLCGVSHIKCNIHIFTYTVYKQNVLFYGPSRISKKYPPVPEYEDTGTTQKLLYPYIFVLRLDRSRDGPLYP